MVMGTQLGFYWCHEDEGVQVGWRCTYWVAHEEKAAGLVLG
jgi:hypothetical protein